jgi:hypothetical protein
MEMENIILSEVSQVQKVKSHMFSLICSIQDPYKYKRCYSIHIEIYTEHVSKSGTGRGDQDSK